MNFILSNNGKCTEKINYTIENLNSPNSQPEKTDIKYFIQKQQKYMFCLSVPGTFTWIIHILDHNIFSTNLKGLN